MMTKFNINPNIITWAISRAGYDLDEFILTKFPKVRDWLDNIKQPTIRQLEEFSQKVHIPFGYLFLIEPPIETISFPFFRTGNTPTNRVGLEVQETISLLQKRQAWLSEYLIELGNEPLSFVGKYQVGDAPELIANDIRQTLSLHELWATEFQNWESARKHLCKQIEEVGIFVSFNGVVENDNRRKIPVEACRGFVLVDNMAPFMFINNNDWKAAQMFTLAHELAHIWLGQSAGFDLGQMLPANDPIEQLCDQVAAEFLVPAHHFGLEWLETKDFRLLARKFKVSPIVAARRALDLSLISKREFFGFYNNYSKDFEPKKTSIGGGDFYATQKARLGLGFVAHLNQALKEGKVFYRDVYRLTSLKGTTYQTFIDQQNL